MSDYLLGGRHNFACDRALAHQIFTIFPQTRQVALASRAFLGRVVRLMLDRGIRQFLELGSGIPTAGHVHEVAAEHRARVLYVDIDPVVLTHGGRILADNPNARIIAGDVLRPAELLARPELTGHLDLSQPLGVLMVGLLHYVPDSADPRGVLDTYKAASADDSYLAVTAACGEHVTNAQQQATWAAYRNADNTVINRTTADVQAYFDGLEVIDPGVVWLPQWRPQTEQDHRHAALGADVIIRGGVGRVRR